MGADGLLTLLVLAAVVAVSFTERADPAFVLGAGVGVLLLAGVLTPARALDGFANPAVAVIGLLFVLVGSLERSPWLPWLAGVLFGNDGSRLGLRGLLPVAALSAFIANVTAVAVLMPAVREWGRRHRVPASRLMIPLGLAATLGGLLTLVGTSSNLVVNGLLVEAGDRGLGLFEIGIVGVPVVLAGLIYLAWAAPRLLPEREDPLGELDANPREYVGWLRVAADGKLVGARVGDLRSLDDLFVAGVERDGTVRSPVDPGEVLEAGDVLAFVGRVDRIAELAAGGDLEPVEAEGEGLGGGDGNVELVEAVVSPSSPIVGRNIREAGFRGRYDAVVLAVHRHGERLHGKIGDIVVEPGDTLLFAAGAGFLARWRFARDFYLVSSLGKLPARLTGRDWTEPLVLLAVVAVVASGLAPLLPAAVAGVLALVVTGRLRPGEVWSTVHWPTLVMIAASIALSHAMTDSGLAQAVVQAGLGAAGHAGEAGLVAAILLLTAGLTEVLDNPAAAALVFPVAAAMAAGHGVSLHAAAVAVAVGASTAFLTPFGYHVNVMVAGAGGYRLRDFIRAGLPLKLIVLLVAALVIPAAW